MRKFILLSILLATVPMLFAEIRSLWVLPWNLTSPQAIDDLIQDTLDASQTELLLEIRYRADALYTQNKAGAKYHNPEPRSYVLEDDGFDPLDYAIHKAHEHDLQVHAWVIVFNATPTNRELVNKNYIFNNHREWITHDEYGRQMRSSRQFGYFIDPGIPEVQAYLLDVFSDIVTGYPLLDGLHLDYIRYPSAQWGYHPVSVRRFEEAKAQGEILSWNEWRMRQVTEFVQKCRARIKSINPSITLSAAVFADIKDARIAYAQDWYAWLKDGLLDRVYPMAYHLDYEVFQAQMQDMKQQGQDDKLVIGLRAWDAKGNSMMPLDNPEYNIAHINKRIALVREAGYAGIALFSYESIRQKEALSTLANLAFPKLTSPPEEPKAPEDIKTVDASVEVVAGSYVIQLSLPQHGLWNWDILDNRGKPLYSRQGSYFSGHSEAYWSGNLSDGQKIHPGAYSLCVYRQEEGLRYYIPINLDTISNE
jgi:uncharacterized lipoprotein YddW (UPF0748 family)